MKKKSLLFILITLLLLGISCNSNKDSNSDNMMLANSDKLNMYYFHFSTRCATCQAIESVTKETISDYYSGEVQNNELFFTDVNLDEESGKKIGESLDINAQALLIVKGNKVYNITNEAFLHARTNPDKLKSIIREKTDLLIK